MELRVRVRVTIRQLGLDFRGHAAVTRLPWEFPRSPGSPEKSVRLSSNSVSMGFHGAVMGGPRGCHETSVRRPRDLQNTACYENVVGLPWDFSILKTLTRLSGLPKPELL